MTAAATSGKTPTIPEIEASSAMLQHLQDEMELIGYLASHDLLAPLRMMIVSCETLKADAAAASNPESQKALQSLEANIQQLKALLLGLQEYIRLETFSVQHVPVEIGEVVAAAAEVLDDTIKATGASLTYDGLPAVHGHRGRLNRLFIHLIENALTFHGQELPQVHISAHAGAEKMWEFSVQDNGIGIDEEFHEIIFRLFQRLHPAEDYPGYGVGLALSQKIVAAHGGRMWVESAPGKGSRFCFTLPAAEK